MHAVHAAAACGTALSLAPRASITASIRTWMVYNPCRHLTWRACSLRYHARPDRPYHEYHMRDRERALHVIPSAALQYYLLSLAPRASIGASIRFNPCSHHLAWGASSIYVRHTGRIAASTCCTIRTKRHAFCCCSWHDIVARPRNIDKTQAPAVISLGEYALPDAAHDLRSDTPYQVPGMPHFMLMAAAHVKALCRLLKSWLRELRLDTTE